MILSGQQYRHHIGICPYIPSPPHKCSQSTLPVFQLICPCMDSILKGIFPRCFPKTDNLITAHSCGRTRGPAVWYLLLFMSVYACSSRSRSSPVFYGAFSLQAARFMRSQAGIHPGRLFSFQGVNVCIGMAIIASYTYWAPEDRNVSCSEKNMEFYVCTLDPLSIYFLIIKSHFLPLYFPENK